MAMHRSSSTTRVTDEYFKVSSSSLSQGSPAGSHRLPADGSASDGQLPVYSPSSYVAKRERSRIRSAENAVHLIPLVLVAYAIILWFFSNPVDLIRKSSSVVSGIEIVKAASAIDVDATLQPERVLRQDTLVADAVSHCRNTPMRFILIPDLAFDSLCFTLFECFVVWFMLGFDCTMESFLEKKKPGGVIG